MKINLKTALFLLLIVIISSNNSQIIILLICAMIHEIGHITAAHILHIKLTELRLGAFGAYLSTSLGERSYRDEICLAAAGPVINIICAMVFVCFTSYIPEFSSGKLFVTASLFLAFINSLPIKDFDGGRILECVLSTLFSPYYAFRVLEVTSFLVIFIIWSASLYFLIRYGFSMSIFLFSLFSFVKLFIKRNSTE